jgi:hypothetical protein
MRCSSSRMKASLPVQLVVLLDEVLLGNVHIDSSGLSAAAVRRPQPNLVDLPRRAPRHARHAHHGVGDPPGGDAAAQRCEQVLIGNVLVLTLTVSAGQNSQSSDLGDLGGASAAWRENVFGETQSAALWRWARDTDVGSFFYRTSQLRSTVTCDQWRRDAQGSPEVRYWI